MDERACDATPVGIACMRLPGHTTLRSLGDAEWSQTRQSSSGLIRLSTSTLVIGSPSGPERRAPPPPVPRSLSILRRWVTDPADARAAPYGMSYTVAHTATFVGMCMSDTNHAAANAQQHGTRSRSCSTMLQQRATAQHSHSLVHIDQGAVSTIDAAV